MKKIILFVILSSLTLFAKPLQEANYSYAIEQGLVTDLLVSQKRLYISSDVGVVTVYSLKNKAEEATIVLPKIHDFMGDEVDSKIFNLDILNNKLLILSQDDGGYSRVGIYDAGELREIITAKEHLNIIRAKFLDEHTLLLALISNDIISYDTDKHAANWTTQASMSKFSSFALSDKKDVVAVGDESGDVHLLKTKEGTKLKTLSGENVDNIFGLDFKGSMIITGGQDRRVGVYNVKNNTAYHKMASFFVYGVGLSPDGTRGAYSYNVSNDIEIFNTQTNEKIVRCKGSGAVANGIYFLNNHEFFLSSNAKKVLYYKIK